MHQHVVGGATHNGIDGEGNGAGHLAIALKSRRVARVHAETLGQPRRRDGADPVDHGMASCRGEQCARSESVDLVDR